MREIRSLFAGLFVAALGASSGPAPVLGASPVPVGYADYDGWNTIRAPRLSDDGRFLAYALTPDYGDPTLVVRDLATGAERREARGSAPLFTADAKFVIYTIVPAQRDIDAAKRAKKSEAEQPKNGLGVVELATGGVTTFERVKSVRVARNGGRFIAFRYEAPLQMPATPGAPAQPPATAKAEKKKDDGGDLAVLDLQMGSIALIPDVTDYLLADDDRRVVYATQTAAGRTDGVRVRDCVTGTVTDVLTGKGRYRSLAITRDGKMLGFLSDVRSYAARAPHDDAYIAELDRAAPAARLAVTEDSAGMPLGAAPSADGSLAFSKDGRRLFLGTAAAPVPAPSETPQPIAVDLWTYRDLRLQSEQLHDAPDERKRTYRAVYDVRRSRFAQLGTPRMKKIETNENPRFALGYDERPYAIAGSWTGDTAADIYAVALRDGSRRLLARNAIEAAFSPGGAYAIVWDRALRHWVSLRTSDGKRTVLAPRAGVTFYDETDDHPGPPPPYGIGGWIAGDRRVIVYDRYDPWLVDPATGAAANLTRGAGRAAQTVYAVLNTDPDREPLRGGRPFLSSLRVWRTFASGYARVAFGGGRPQTLLRADKAINNVPSALDPRERIAPPLRARRADRVVFTQESYREFRDLWSSDLRFARPRKVTNANPQLARYRWGNESLIAYRSAAGIPLRAVLLTPDHFDAHKTYPMLVYFYERFSDQFHTFYAPVPRYPTISRYVSHGYVVLLPDVVYRVGHPGRSALDCILGAVNAVTRRGFIDPRRIGIAGHSWAGYQINYLLTQTDRFRAAEAGAAVANMTSAYGGIRLESGVVREFQYESGQSRIGASPWERPDLYLENSGLFHVANVHTPYLTMHNDADNAVPFEQGVEFITAMRRLGKPAYMFVFNGKEHNLRDTPADRDDLLYWTVHFDEWFDYWLMSAPRPKWLDGVDYLHRGERDVRPLFGEHP